MFCKVFPTWVLQFKIPSAQRHFAGGAVRTSKKVNLSVAFGCPTCSSDRKQPKLSKPASQYASQTQLGHTRIVCTACAFVSVVASMHLSTVKNGDCGKPLIPDVIPSPLEGIAAPLFDCHEWHCGKPKSDPIQRREHKTTA